MPIDEQQASAVARIALDGTNKRGTGFLIPPTHFWTAYHVIVADGANEPHSNIKLSFPAGPGNVPPAHETVVSGSPIGEPTTDWALLTCKEPPPNRTPFVLASAPPAVKL